ncbi:type II toxin-antitoxin system RelE/ParE family toxin [Chamaesiphon sp. GL140_3_metabinner_50]|uniref:type II toxin-antitoxin system RelE/ParE family toxin n=1 Tax=Chamaesiphon sp. GL140_3_metabinner_50 TaxID=2970812 RepID=UPI0025D34027|nr:type II toxin-antitoxin system RelE/ParE family toxin [Chamaesiphon sp. GL140_3_metabinner_50]
MSDWSVEFYADADGDSAVLDWYESLDEKTKAKLIWIFQLLETNGIELGMPYIKPLGDKMYEIRADVNRNAFRVVYFLYTGRRFILLHGFQKKTQKTPTKELARARTYLEDFIERNIESTDLEQED